MDELKKGLLTFLFDGDYICSAIDCYSIKKYDIDYIWFVDQLMNFFKPKIQDMLIAAWHSPQLWDALEMSEEEYDNWIINGS